MNEIGRLLLVIGLVLAVVGLVLLVVPADRIPLVGRLPGDIVIKKKHITIYLPVVTMILLSVVLTLILNLISRR